ncbi:RNA-BINDING PROTEIN [Salix purpurea]|uniref:RNA-BINDING PROTEIN n=1 Tax=Salix purpurea TaxID=77065 RepID=A0A9Q0QF95_SALPP|nr:RNA-BINDING PROTEIN [Salix purpurea]
MHSKQNTIRVLGQRSIPSSFIFRSSNPGAIDSNQEGQKEDSKKNPRISFSDFLDKRLHKSPVVHKTVKGKSRPFWTPLGPPINGGGFTDHRNEVQKEKEERSFVLDDMVFQQFKPTSGEKGDDVISVGDGEKRDGMGPFSKKRNSSSAFGIGSSGGCDFGTSITSFVKGSNHVGEVGISTVNDVPGSRKRNLFGGGGQNHTARKPSLVLGVHPSPSQKGRKENSIGNKKRRPLYNHYANGSGWWDCDMEGVDSEEVGYGEIWEGIGSTTFGGIEWH